MAYKRYKLIKEFNDREGKLPVGATITILDDHVYYNDGMVHPAYYGLLKNLVEKEEKEGFHYLREVPIPYNQI